MRFLKHRCIFQPMVYYMEPVNAMNSVSKFKNKNSKRTYTSKMEQFPWREASSVIIAAKTSLPDLVGKDLTNVLSGISQSGNYSHAKFDYRILMLKRSGLSSFMANAYVFPGGMIELSDYSKKWLAIFNNAGFSDDDLYKFCKSISGPRPPLFETSVTLSKAKISKSDCLLPDLTMRIAAIRETFEETGILLLTSSKHFEEKDTFVYTFEEIDLKLWRQKIHKNPSSFLDLCLEAKVCPNIWCLKEWWNWLTPNVGHRRYDTMFYICCLPKLPEAWPDQTEVTALKWCAPNKILEENFEGSVFLAPPQTYELSRLLNFNHIRDLQQFARARELRGVNQWMPVIASTTDGAVSFLPGDDLYPEKPDIQGLFANPEYPFTIEELRNRCQDLNRMEINGVVCTVNSNVLPPCGHVQPSKFPVSQPVIQSFL